MRTYCVLGPGVCFTFTLDKKPIPLWQKKKYSEDKVFCVNFWTWVLEIRCLQFMKDKLGKVKECAFFSFSSFCRISPYSPNPHLSHTASAKKYTYLFRQKYNELVCLLWPKSMHFFIPWENGEGIRLNFFLKFHKCILIAFHLWKSHFRFRCSLTCPGINNIILPLLSDYRMEKLESPFLHGVQSIGKYSTNMRWVCGMHF